ncbi:unnamed protein product [Mesocestoides corti]|uniref:BAT2 N-terminal domain-containing protein n=1 Tax=Mesocestoides corti TaxID=53468 RepID=A0A0R3U6R5_MESCO|nr:unnamed protein product [Mesocestoides corti]
MIKGIERALRSGGLQLVGKLQGTRRNPPPPPWVPSIKAEMGGQDTRINIVPPGGSGWGTGSTNPTSSEMADIKSEPISTTPSSPSLLKDIVKGYEKVESDDTSNSLCPEAPQSSLVKPPQKPFFAPRSSKTLPPKQLQDISVDFNRPLTGKTTGPTVPFYQRPPITASANQNPSSKESVIAEETTEDKTITPAVSNSATTPHTGWAAVTTEEPDFQERINFSDDDEDEVEKTSVVEQPKDNQNGSTLSENKWEPDSIQPQVPVPIHSYPMSAWDRSACFNSIPAISQTFSVPFCGPIDGAFSDASAIPVVRTDMVPGREPLVLSEQLQRPSFTVSEAQAQAQREERTLAYKSAVNRAQMARKKICSDEDTGEPKRKDHQSIESPKNSLADSNAFSMSIMHSAAAAIAGPGAFPMHTSVNQSPSHNVEPVIAAMNVLYNSSFPNLMHSVTAGGSHLPSHVKSQSPMTNSWNPTAFSSTNQPPFIQPPYPLSNSPKLQANQGFYLKSDHFPVNAFNQPQVAKGGHCQGLQSLPTVEPLELSDRRTDNAGHTYPTTAGEPAVLDHLNFQASNPRISTQDSDPSATEKHVESDSNKQLVPHSLSRNMVINGHHLHISAHEDGTRTAFTPPASSAMETIPPQHPQPQPAQQQTHITPLMEVDLSGKWSEKDFDTFPPPASRGNYLKSLKSNRGGLTKHITVDDKSNSLRCPPYGSGSRQSRIASRDLIKRSLHSTDEVCENLPLNDRVDDQPTDEPAVDSSGETHNGNSRQLHRRADGTSGTFPRQLRGRGSGRLTRPTRVVPAENEDGPRQNGDYDRQQASSSYCQRERWRGSSGRYTSNRKGDVSVAKGPGAVAPPCSGRGRTNFSRSGPGNRRQAGNDDAYKALDSHSRKSRSHVPNQRKIDEEPEGSDVLPRVGLSGEDFDAVALSDSEQGTTTLQPTEPGCQQQSQRPQRGGSNGGRLRRGQHGGSQRQSQRRNRADRTTTRRHNNHRRHPDEDDHDFKGGSANGNSVSAATGSGKSIQHGSSGDSNSKEGGGANTESNASGAPTGHQQKNAVDSTNSCASNFSAPIVVKSRKHAHSVTLTSDVEIWETASESFSSSLFGTSPGCSVAECTNINTTAADTTKTGNLKNLSDGYFSNKGGHGYLNGHPSKRSGQRRPIPKIIGEIVPLMSINAEAPPSYCENSTFLDSPPPNVKSTSGIPVLVESSNEFKDAASVVASSVGSSEDGFMEVRSKSSRKQQKAKLQQKSQKSSVSSDERSSVTKPKSQDPGKLCKQVSSSPKGDRKPSRSSKGVEVSGKDKQHATLVTVSSPSSTVTPSQTSSNQLDPNVKKLTTSTSTPTNAWLKPLQETISEKAAALAAQASSNARVSQSDAVKAVTSTSSVKTLATSSYAWSVVVGSRASNTSTSCISVENASASMTKVEERPTTNPHSVASEQPSKAPVVNNPSQNLTPNSTVFEADNVRQSFSKPDETESQEDGVSHMPEPAVSNTTIAPSPLTVTTTTSANVCKVRPQKQPTGLTRSDSPPSSKSEATSFSVSVPYPVSGNPLAAQASQFRRSLGEVGDWLGKTSVGYTGNSSSAFFDGYGAKKVEPTPDSSIGLNPAAAAAIYLQQQQQQQQPFRQSIQPLQPQQPMMGFGLPDLSMRHQNNRVGGACSQNGMGADSYFTAPPFAAGSAGQATQQPPPRGLYHPPPPTHQRGFPSWQHQQHQSQQEAVMAAVAVAPQAAALWSSSYTPPPPPPPHHQHPPYVGVIGADRPSSVSMASRLHSANGTASLYGSGSMRGGSGGAVGGGSAAFATPAQAPPPPSGLYASSPTHPTPPPPHQFDPNFAYTSGGLANSPSVFSHHSGPPAGPAMLTAPHRPTGAPRSLNEHPQPPPVFINAPHTPFPAAAAAISVHGLAGPPPSMTTPGLHF